ncbi:MAG: secondary thiamine-phosphate synthase enzyme YjbQ [Kiritimatiellae bacterium]|nr:secondary thiamine-phosphate synthase enzyme YjbQ [Kiritimatiellia bacterium]
MEKIEVRTTRRSEFIEITSMIRDAVSRLKLADGVVTVFVPHTTAAVTINENADPDVVRDILAALERLVPCDGAYAHAEGNAAAHVKAMLVGSSVRVGVSAGALQLGTWQGVFFCEFDGPRRREIWVF